MSKVTFEVRKGPGPNNKCAMTWTVRAEEREGLEATEQMVHLLPIGSSYHARFAAALTIALLERRMVPIIIDGDTWEVFGAEYPDDEA